MSSQAKKSSMHVEVAVSLLSRIAETADPPLLLDLNNGCDVHKSIEENIELFDFSKNHFLRFGVVKPPMPPCVNNLEVFLRLIGKVFREQKVFGVWKVFGECVRTEIVLE
jgi:hypothetical protein